MPQDAGSRAAALYSVGSRRPTTMMQPCASGGEARGGGPFCGTAKARYLSRYTATSPHDRTFTVSLENADTVSFYSALLLVRRRYAAQCLRGFRRSSCNATARSAACAPGRQSSVLGET